MTRITTFGRKRTHHEAQFNNIFESEGKEALQSEDGQPKKKRRKNEAVNDNSTSEVLEEVPQKKGWGRSEEIKGDWWPHIQISRV